jgi:hypothetical protein
MSSRSTLRVGIKSASSSSNFSLPAGDWILSRRPVTPDERPVIPDLMPSRLGIEIGTIPEIENLLPCHLGFNKNEVRNRIV